MDLTTSRQEQLGRQAGGQEVRKADRQVVRLADKIQVDFKIFKLLYNLNYLIFYFV